MGRDPRQALPFALATELLHNFFLIHDDIEDGDTMRRDQKTLWAELGIPNALNVSDYLIARAYRLILEAPLPGEINLRLARVFSYALEKTVEGQALDINLRASEKVKLETYYRIVQLKTAYYLALTWVGGAIVAGAPDNALDPFWQLGRRLGPAFQIRDDIIDLTEGKGRGGEIGCDIREGKPSIFFAFVLDRQKGTPEERRRLIDIAGRPRESTSQEDVLWAIEFFRRRGALDFAQAEASRLADEAVQILSELPLSEEGREQFREMAKFIIGRKF
jgi:geranylgeranyl pyrophosphate synthase